MVKKMWKKILAMGLTAVTILGLAACGKNGSEGNKNDPKNQLAKQNVFAYENIDLSEFGDNVSVRKLAYSEGRVYALLDIYIENTGNTVEPKVTVSSEAATVDIAVDNDMAVDPGFGVGMPNEYVPPTHVVRVLSFLPDGSDRQYYDLEVEQEGTGETHINQVAFSSERVYAVNYGYVMDTSDPQNPIYQELWELVCWDNSGTMLWKTGLNDCFADVEYFYINNMFVGADGNAYATIESDGMQVASFDKEGNLLNSQKLALQDSQYVYNVFLNQEDKFTIIDVNADWTKYYATTYDPVTGTLGEKIELPGNIMQFNDFSQGGRTADLVLSSSTGVFTYNIGDPEVIKLMDFINSDLESSYLNNITMIDDNHFAASYSDIINYKQKIAVFSKVAPEDVPDKTVIVLGTNYFDYDVRKRVIDFNKTNTKYRIAVKEYYTYATAEDYMASYTQLNNDIIAGNMPDILVVDSNIPVDNYISKGLVADIGKLIEADEELSQESFMANVFEAFSVDDVLYYVVPQFNVRTLIGKTSFLGDRTGWNMEEFMGLGAQLPEGSSMFGDMTRQSFMYQILQFCGTDFIDSATGTCKFDSQEFINLLEYAKSLPEEVIYGEDYDWSKYETQYRENRTILMMLYLNNFSDINYSIKGQFGDEVTFIGFPNESKNGSVINASTSYILSAKSKALDGAWEFARYYLTDEYQETLEWGLPVNKDAFLKVASKATQKPYYEDENGNKVEYDQSYWINNEEIIIPPMTQAEVDDIVAFVESVNRRVFYDEEVVNIIAEEAAPFYEGQKSAKEVADIIQNRLNLYIMANR